MHNKTKTNLQLSPAVILDVTYSGYGLLRSLQPYNIPLYGFTYDKDHIEVNTKLANEIIIYGHTNTDLLDKLISLAKRLPKKPVLFLTNDEKVEFLLDNLSQLKEYYHINIPPTKLSLQLLDKIKLSEIVNQLDIKVPKTLSIEKAEALLEVEKLNFPIILKPFCKSEKWSKAGFSKTILYDSYKALQLEFDRLFEVENRLIIQEFIPGGDDAIYYCLVYYSNKGECLTAFTGQKIRQWNILKGSTASTKTIENKNIKSETERIFDAIKFNGLGSIEYKKHEINGEYYMIEPTVGRVNMQEYIATYSGNNIPLIAYCDLSGEDIKPIDKVRKNAIYIDEKCDIRSAKVYLNKGELSLKGWYRSINGARCYRYLNWHDWKISIKILIITLKPLLITIIRHSIKRVSIKK